MKIAVIGGGPAGMMAAIKAAETLGSGAGTVLFDKNERLGRKIHLTGKGRCNLTNLRPWEEFSTHIHPNQGFLKHSFHAFSNRDTISFFESLGVPVVTLQGQRVYPASLTAADVAEAMERRVRELGVETRCGVTVGSLSELDGFKAVIIATGGLSYPVTGSTGDGYRFAREAGHSIVPTFPSETALHPHNYDASLHGLEMKNCGLQLIIDRQPVQSWQGDFNFTPDGLESGIAYLLSRRAVKALANGQRVELELDLKPALSLEKLEARIRRDIAAKGGNPGMRLLLRGLMPEQMIDAFCRVNPGLSTSTLAGKLKRWPMRISGYKGYERAVVTAGGVSLKEIVPKTMASRIRPGLFFCGEVLDLDGDTGGYNLQIAFSTGAAAGCSAARYILEQ